MHDITGYLPYASVRQILADWERAYPALEAAAADLVKREMAGTPAGRLAVRPPVSPPGQLFAAGANYREHIIQMAVAHGLGPSGRLARGTGGAGSRRHRRAQGPR